MGVASDFGAEIDGRQNSTGIYPDVVEDVGVEWGDKGNGVGFEVGDAGDVMEEVPGDKFFLQDPKLFSAVIDNCVLMQVVVNNEGTGGSGEEVGEEVDYKRLLVYGLRSLMMGWTHIRGGRQDGGDGGGNLCLWKGGSQDVLSCNVLLRIESKVLVDK